MGESAGGKKNSNRHLSIHGNLIKILTTKILRATKLEPILIEGKKKVAYMLKFGPRALWIVERKVLARQFGV